MNVPMEEEGRARRCAVRSGVGARRMRRMMAMAGKRSRGGRRGGARFGPGFGGRGPFMGPGFPGAFFGGGPKVGRGDVRVAILQLLAEEPMHGYQIIRELTDRSGGVWRPSPGSIYPTLQLLEDEGLVRAEDADGRRVYSLTPEGRAEVDRRAGSSRAPWEHVGDVGESMLELRAIAFGVAGAVMQIAQTGTDAQIARAKDILADARRRLYGVLAEDEPGEA
jgi:DNA-binding PadR family transcriptional regulator